MKSFFTSFLIGAVILLSQYFLSRSKHKLLGGIIPLLVTLFASWCFFIRTPRLGTNCILPFCILVILLLSEWIDGIKSFEKNKKEEITTELKKMKAHDLNDY